MTRREFLKAFVFLWSLLSFKKDSNAEVKDEQLHEAMFWRRVEDG